MPRENGGTGGLIPGAAVPGVKAAARLMGVLLHDDDWAPRTIQENADLAPVQQVAA
jgi:hypothetical protein